MNILFLQKKTKLQKKGFTLIESLVAISILVLATLGPLSIASKGLSTSLFARDQVTSFYLAQEAIEYIRNSRDTFALASYSSGTTPGTNWLGTYFSTCSNPGGCRINALDSNPATAVIGCNSTCTNMTVDSQGRYTYGASALSQFNRTVQIVDVNADEKRVTVIMNWKTAGQSKTFQIQENIFNVY